MIKETVLRKWYRKSIFKAIPEYGLLSIAACFTLNCCVYWGTQHLMKNASLNDFTTSLDLKIPFVKEWIVIYLICFAFWVINYYLTIREGKEKWYRFATADMMSRLVCAAFFILLPTTNVRPAVSGNDIFSWLVRHIYQMDPPINLFPSVHCLVSWFCFIGIRQSKKIPKWYKVFSCVFAILVCASTQFIKQHYLIDIAGGVLIAELCFYISNHTHIYLRVQKFFDWLELKIFGGESS